LNQANITWINKPLLEIDPRNFYYMILAKFYFQCMDGCIILNTQHQSERVSRASYYLPFAPVRRWKTKSEWVIEFKGQPTLMKLQNTFVLDFLKWIDELNLDLQVVGGGLWLMAGKCIRCQSDSQLKSWCFTSHANGCFGCYVWQYRVFWL
jgi:hypothetical protein